MAFQKVTRRKSKLRMALMGVSNSGKTLGALYIAYGITGDWGKIALIDTEHERARFYAERTDLEIPTGEFLYEALTPPFSPKRYNTLIDEAADAVGEDGVIIVDSLSHAWNGEGGVLDIKEQISAQAGKNSYTAWNEAGQEQNALINKLFAVQCHTIVTLRSKMQYVLETNERGKQQPVKVGLGAVQRDDMEYEFDIVLSIDRSHIATASKDVTFLDGYGAMITPELGRAIAGWLDNGIEPEKCADCGRTIISANGRTVEQIIEGSMKYAGRKMCLECFGKWHARDRGRREQLENAKIEVPEGIHPGDMSAEEFAEVLQHGFGAGGSEA